MKNEHLTPSVVTVDVREDTSGNSPKVTADLSGYGVGYVRIYGKMTEQQRRKFIKHIEGYVKLLFDEAEKEVEFRRKWDKDE